MADNVTVMVLNVDLQCPCCYKKVKKILCKFPQIRDQLYNVKANTVTITVVCCSPEKIRDKLYCKGAKIINCIEIKKPTEKPPPQEKPPSPEKPTKDQKPNPPTQPVLTPTPPQPEWVRTCCRPCYEGYGGGPCYHGYGVPPPPLPCYDGYGCNRLCHVSNCDYYFSTENSQTCSIM